MQTSPSEIAPHPSSLLLPCGVRAHAPRGGDGGMLGSRRRRISLPLTTSSGHLCIRITLCPCLVRVAMAAVDWGYEEHNGPDTWASKYPPAGGKSQSPIDIVSSLVKSGEFEAPLAWTYGSGICKSIVNTGCGWRVDVDGSGTELSGGPLSSKYELVQFHCHWGDSNHCGSEHTVDGKCYAGELHFVHWNKDQFASCAEAVPSPNGLTVLGIFLEVGEKNDEIEKLCEAIVNIPNKDEKVELGSDIDPVAFYPSDHSYWTYSGSLTTPPCYESVTWIVFKNPITVSEEQLKCFRQMKKPTATEGEDHGYVDHNYRPPQSLNDREICEVL